MWRHILHLDSFKKTFHPWQHDALWMVDAPRTSGWEWEAASAFQTRNHFFVNVQLAARLPLPRDVSLMYLIHLELVSKPNWKNIIMYTISYSEPRCVPRVTLCKHFAGRNVTAFLFHIWNLQLWKWYFQKIWNIRFKHYFLHLKSSIIVHMCISFRCGALNLFGLKADRVLYIYTCYFVDL